MNHSPANILRHYFIGTGICSLPTAKTDWPASVNQIDEQDHDAVLFVDSTARHEGRYQRTGKTITKPGVQIIVRSLDQGRAYLRMSYIIGILDSLLKQKVEVEDDTYLIHATHRKGEPVSLATELMFRAVDRQQKEIKRGRFMFALNLLMSFGNPDDGIVIPTGDFWTSTIAPSGTVDGTNRIFTTSPTVDNEIFGIYFDEILQPRANFTAMGTTFTFANGKQPEAGTVLTLVKAGDT